MYINIYIYMGAACCRSDFSQTQTQTQPETSARSHGGAWGYGYDSRLPPARFCATLTLNVENKYIPVLVCEPKLTVTLRSRLLRPSLGASTSRPAEAATGPAADPRPAHTAHSLLIGLLGLVSRVFLMRVRCVVRASLCPVASSAATHQSGTNPKLCCGVCVAVFVCARTRACVCLCQDNRIEFY